MPTSHLHHRPRTLAIAICAVAAIAAALTVTITHRGAPGLTAAPAGRSPAASSGAPQAGGSGEAGRSVRDPDLRGVDWVRLGGFRVPASAQDGPRVMAGGLASGFADTPAGAVLAAANIVTRTAWECGPDVFGPTIEKQVAGADAMALLQNDIAAYGQDASRLPGLVYPRLAAYALDSYKPGDAMVTIVAGAAGSGGASMYNATLIEVQWMDGDWRVIAPAFGTWKGSYIPSPAGYTPFPPVSGK